eukprot:4274338-Pleurochrysis_carterae.AAC.2
MVITRQRRGIQVEAGREDYSRHEKRAKLGSENGKSWRGTGETRFEKEISRTEAPITAIIMRAPFPPVQVAPSPDEAPSLLPLPGMAAQVRRHRFAMWFC